MSDFADRRAALAEVVAIPVTPFDRQGRLDPDTYRALVRRLLDAGIRTVTPNGNTSEFYSLTPEERRLEVELTMAEVTGTGSGSGTGHGTGSGAPEAQVVVGVGHDTDTAVAAARQAREAGAGMVMVHQPVHPYISVEGWADYHRAIARAVPELGVVPYLRSPRIEGAVIARLADDCPNVIGVKYAVPDVARFAAVARDAGLERFVWVAGLAELYAPAYFACGATGFTSGLVNVAPELSTGMLRALRAGDYPAAMAVWERIRAFEDLRAARHSADNVTVIKEALAALGLCRRDVRPPVSLLAPEGRAAVADILVGWAAHGAAGTTPATPATPATTATTAAPDGRPLR